MIPILGAVVDLDDTLYPQKDFLLAAASAVGAAGVQHGLPPLDLEAAVAAELLSGSDRGGTIDRALERLGLAPAQSARILPSLVEAFLAARPARLEFYPGARAALERLSSTLPVACLTDGAPSVQHAKVDALGLRPMVSALVITDELGGRSARKPVPSGMWEACRRLGISPENLVVIGDRPGKDMAVANATGSRSIRVRTGEYSAAEDLPPATWSAPDFASAVELLLGLPELVQAPRATPATP